MSDDDFRRSWEHQVASQYSNFLYNHRHWRTKKICVQADILKAWEEEWMKETYQNRSSTTKRNRLSEPAGPGTGPSRHTGGCRSYAEHAAAIVSYSFKNCKRMMLIVSL